ncbi:MAG: putative Ig domain-containing protein [Planctomycetes bacterium]|nr:putative Ig domain-containing protein [Planctomycetota bacterium]
MGPRKLEGKSLLAFGSLALFGVLLSPWSSEGVPVNDPGPFYPLLQGHRGEPYQDALPRGASYRLDTGSLPAGVALEGDGRLRGTPTQAGLFEAVLTVREASGLSYPARVSLTVREPDERDLPALAPSYRQRGAFAVEQDDLRIRVRSSFDQAEVRTLVRVYRPRGQSDAPLILFHRGRGFDHDMYDTLLGHLASHGIAVASVQDTLSFAGNSFGAQSFDYDYIRPELGMQSASGVLEAVSDLLFDLANDPSEALFGAFDPDNLFFCGHSRGGGAVHASHERSLRLRLKGLIYLMPFDLRYFPECAPPGLSPAYPIFDATPRTPSLVIAAENDGDLTYPIADQLIDRASGPTTQVTIYGGVHNLISDRQPAEGNDTISRRSEQEQAADWIVAFVKRWAEGKTDLDRRLYAGGHAADPDAAVASWNPSARTLVWEDASDADDSRNAFGPNYVLDLRRSEYSIYPNGGDMASLGLKHTVLNPRERISIWRMASDAPLDVDAHRRLVLRMTQTSAVGWDWGSVWLRLIDAQGSLAWVQLHGPQGTGYLPVQGAANRSRHRRFVDVNVDLRNDLLAGSATPIDLGALLALDVILVRDDAVNARSVVVDAVRFE